MTLSVALFLVLGLVIMIGGAELLVRGSSRLATSFGISPLVVGLTVVAFGTSSPELAVSVMSAFKGQADLALGNVVGSNIFNVLFILGISALIVPLIVAQQLVRFDVPVMIAVAVACLPVFFAGYRISRFNGAAFLFFYTAYLVYLIFSATNHGAAGALGSAMWYFIFPITAITLIVITVRELALGKKAL